MSLVLFRAIQAAYRGMVARRKVNADYELENFLKHHEHGSELLDEPPSLSIQEKVKLRAAKKRATAALVADNKEQMTALDCLASVGLIPPLDDAPSDGVGTSNGIGGGHVGGPSLGEEASQHKRVLKHSNSSPNRRCSSPNLRDLPPIRPILPSAAASIQPSAGSSSSSAAPIDNGLLKRDITKLRKQMTNMEQSFRDELGDIKRIVREIAVRQNTPSSGGGSASVSRKSGALSKIQV